MTQLERRLADVARLAAVSAGRIAGSIARHKVSPTILRACAADLRAATAYCEALILTLEEQQK